MSTYLLIHGAWHGAWCWFKIIPYLENKGHKVITPNLPGHGIDLPGRHKILKSLSIQELADARSLIIGNNGDLLLISLNVT